MDELERWKIEREVFRKWLASKDWGQLLEIANDLQTRLDYEADKMDTFLNRDKFCEFMSRCWNLKGGYKNDR